MDLFSTILDQYDPGECVILHFKDTPFDFARDVLKACGANNPTFLLSFPDLAVRVMCRARSGNRKLQYVGHNRTLSQYRSHPIYRDLTVFEVRNLVQEDDAPLQCPGGFSDLLGGDTP